MLTAIIIDKEPFLIKEVEKKCVASKLIRLEKAFTNINEGEKYLHKFPVDLLLIDIEMAKMSGIDFNNIAEQNTMVIFTSSKKELAIDAYSMNALDFLLHPFTAKRMEAALTKAIDYYNIRLNSGQSEEKQNIFLRADYGLQKFTLSEILYIESLGDYINIYLQNKNRITTRLTMKGMLEKLNRNEFIRVHRQFIIPLSKIENVKNKIISVAGKEIPIGNVYRKDTLKHLKYN